MALSNWDTLAIGPDGKSNNGEFEFDNGTSVEIYKNWAHVANKAMYKEDATQFTNNIVGHVNHGDISMGGVEISAIRGPQNAIFILATSYIKDDKEYRKHHFAGIGCSGYHTKIEEFIEWKGLDVEYDDVWNSSSNYNGDEYLDGFRDFLTFFKDGEQVLQVMVDEEFGELTDWVGVMPTTLEEFKSFLEKEIGDYNTSGEEWLESIDWNELTRFNQGDAFFIGTDEAQTKVGEEEETIASQLIDNIHNSNNS
jgi:hypothetical protein